jgi:hypothetical protein
MQTAPPPPAPPTGPVVMVATPKGGKAADPQYSGYVVAEADGKKAEDLVAKIVHSHDGVHDLGAISARKLGDAALLPGKIKRL